MHVVGHWLTDSLGTLLTGPFGINGTSTIAVLESMKDFCLLATIELSTRATTVRVLAR